jgi:hypothetical protein
LTRASNSIQPDDRWWRAARSWRRPETVRAID